mgnify:FL=1
MKIIFAKAAAAFALAALTAAGTAAPVCAAQGETKIQLTKSRCYYYDENGMPVWSADKCDDESLARVSEIQPGDYYGYKRYDKSYSIGLGGCLYKYSLIRIEEIHEYPGQSGPVREALCSDPYTSKTFTLDLDTVKLFNVDFFTSISAVIN